jgi:protocatechuate 3,4-dioxygenase beta subunit
VHVLSRRRVIQLAGVAGASALVAACSGNANPNKQPGRAEHRATPTAKPPATPSAAAGACPKTTPPETAGPHPGDGSNGPNVLGEQGVVRSDIRSSFGALSGWAEGVQTTIELTVLDVTRDCAKGEGMAVYVWHCDRAGDYSLYSGDASDKNYLRGVQVAGQDGRVSFTSIFPACDAGRWPHIHFEVFDSLDAAVAGENARLTSQVALPEGACKKVFDYDKGYSASVQNMSNVPLEKDSVFGDGWDGELATVTGDPSSAMLVTLTIGVGEKPSPPPP